MSNNKLNKRTYIRRRKFLVENSQTIETRLSLIEQKLGRNVFSQPLSKLAQYYSKAIEASCWDPKMKIDDEQYQQMSALKTEELCNALFIQYCGDYVRPQIMINTIEHPLIPGVVNHLPFREEAPPLIHHKVQLPPVTTLLSV